MADEYVRRGNTILTAADYVAYGNSSGKMTYFEVSRARIEASRVHLEELRTNVRYDGLPCGGVPGVLAIRKTSCNGTCCFQEGHWLPRLKGLCDVRSV